MVDSEPWERKLLHHFSGHKFDWRWEMLETLTTQIVERWETLKKYADIDKLSKHGELDHQATSHLCRALANDEDDLPGVELMMSCVSCVAIGLGHSARWLRGCDCHVELLISHAAPKHQKQTFVDEGFEDGHCPLMGRRLVHLVHGGLVKMKENVKFCNVQYNTLLVQAPEAQRVKVLTFDRAVRSRLTDWMSDKLDYILEPPILFVGLIGMYFSFSVDACVDIAQKLLDWWDRLRGIQMGAYIMAQVVPSPPPCGSWLLGSLPVAPLGSLGFPWAVPLPGSLGPSLWPPWVPPYHKVFLNNYELLLITKYSLPLVNSLLIIWWPSPTGCPSAD
jgi:hypothetical protein